MTATVSAAPLAAIKGARPLPIPRKKSGRICYPLFSDDDADLRALKWRIATTGYPVTTVNWKECGKAKTETPRAHRIVLSRMIGRPLTPQDICDHINGDKIDSRRENLRLVNVQQNSQATRQRRAIPRGVRLCRQRWQARVNSAGTDYHLGTFDTMEEAASAAATKRRELGFLEQNNQ